MPSSRTGDIFGCAGFWRSEADAVKRGTFLFRRISVVLLLLLSPHAMAQMQAPEPDLKAAILVNMLLFIDWPAQSAQATDRIQLCYLGDSAVATALAQLDGKSIKGKPLRVQQVGAEHAASCHALYLSAKDDGTLTRNAPLLRTAGVLLAGDSPGYLQRGAMLNLELLAGRVAFDIDLRSTRQAGLVVSSKVLRLARQVVE
jgi:hypothetical protein